MGTAHIPPSAMAVVADAWPESVADPRQAEAYEAALTGMDPGLVRDVVAQLSGSGRLAPPPGILRTVVLAHQSTAATSAPVLDPGIVAGRARASSRARLTIAAAVAGLAAGVAAVASRLTWLRIANTGTDRVGDYAGTSVSGGTIVALAALIAVAAAVTAAALLVRGAARTPAGIAFAALAVSAVVAVFGCMRGVMLVSESRERFVFEIGTGAGGVTSPLRSLVTVSAGAGLWIACVATLVALGASIYGLLTLRR